MKLGQVCLRRGEERGAPPGKRRVYDNEAAWVDEDCTDGGVVDVIDGTGAFVARGFFNSQSKILVRVLTRDPNEAIDREFFRRRLTRAWACRQALGFHNACRVVFGDSDGLPGLTVDKFGDYLSLQIVSLGMESWKDVLTELLAGLFAPKGIYQRNDVPVREKEGLPQVTGCLYGQVPGAGALPGARCPNAGRSSPWAENRPFPGPARKSGAHPALLLRSPGFGSVLPHRRFFHPCRPVWGRICGSGGCVPGGTGHAVPETLPATAWRRRLLPSAPMSSTW